MRPHRILLTFVTLALLSPALAGAQEYTGLYSLAHRGFLGFSSEPVPRNSPTARARVIVDVIAESPAARAGLMEGDTLLRINGLAATQQVLSSPFAPGDTVVLRVRRDGRERDITVVAAERTSNFHYIPDSVGHRVSIIMNRMRSGVDTISLPRISVMRLGDDSVTTIIIDGDTISNLHAIRGRLITPWAIHSDSFRVHLDSLRVHFDSLRVHVDGLRGHFGDSLFRAIRAPHARWFSDSAEFGRLFTPEGRSFYWQPDSNGFRGYDILTSYATLGMRAVAGAELSPLNPGLSEYFGATDGVLVLNARDGTPAARAGLRAGDVIVRVGDTTITSIADLRRSIERARGEAVTLRVLRRGENVDVVLRR